MPQPETPASSETVVPHSRPALTASPRNVLLLTLDTTRTDSLGCYGSETSTTPHLDALAARGTRFENAIAPVALTRPAHATLLTGLLPHRHGVWSNGPYRLEAGDNPMVARFQRAGFSTAAVVASFVLSRSFGLAHGFDIFDDATREIEGGDPEKVASEVVDAASELLGGPVRPPFFLWLHFYDPHHPYTPPEPFRSRFPGHPYAGEVGFMDEAIGRVLELLDEQDWLAETLVVAVADHGEGLGEHGETTHGYFLYDNTVRVPMILAGPGVPGGASLAQQVTLADVMPTLLDAFDLSRGNDRLDGKSFWSGLRTGEIQNRPALLENRALLNQFGWSPLAGIRAAGWKWIEAPEAELYDLQSDPDEVRNLIAEERERAERMTTMWAEARPPERKQAVGALSPEEEEQLASLGYLSAASTPSDAVTSDVDPKSVAEAIPHIEALIAARRENRVSEIARQIDQILAVDAGNLFALRLRGQLLIEQRRFEDAIATLTGVVDRGEAHPEALAYLADAYEKTGRIEAAIGWYERATTPPWIYWPALESLARLSVRQPDRLPRERVLARLRGLSPTSGRECLSLARGFAIVGQFATGEIWFQRALASDTGLTEARVGLAQMQAKRGALDLALETLSQIEQETVESVFVTASVLATTGRRDRACHEFQKASRMNPDNVNLLLGLGRQLQACGQPNLAISAYGSLLSRQPDHPMALFELARLEEARGRNDRALALYERFLAVAPPRLAQQRSHAKAALRQ